jgi:hypothetical protein
VKGSIKEAANREEPGAQFKKHDNPGEDAKHPAPRSTAPNAHPGKDEIENGDEKGANAYRDKSSFLSKQGRAQPPGPGPNEISNNLPKNEVVPKRIPQWLLSAPQTPEAAIILCCWFTHCWGSRATLSRIPRCRVRLRRHVLARAQAPSTPETRMPR